MHYILFVLLFTTNGAAVTSQEFDSRVACNTAETILHRLQDNKFTHINTACMPKK